MDSRVDESRSIPRVRLQHNRGDLIDFSDPDDNKSSNNILDLFDPLGHTEKQNQNSKSSIERARTSFRFMRPIGLGRRDRRQRATSACHIPNGVNILPISRFHEAENIHQKIFTVDVEAAIENSSTSGECVESSDNDGLSLKKVSRLSLRSSGIGTNSTVSSIRFENGVNSSINHDIDRELGNKKPASLDNKLRLVRKHQRSNQELVLLTDKIKSFRAQYKHHDTKTNPGLVFSPTLYSSKVRDMSVKICIISVLAPKPINFTCNVSTTVEHLISHAVCSMFEYQEDSDSMDNYMLKVTGKDEYFESKLCLADYALVTHCWKFDLDVRLTLVRIESIKRHFMRTSKDDFRCKSLLCPDDLLSRVAILKFSDLNYENLNITIETFEREAQKLYLDVTNRSTCLQTQSLLQTTKAICSLMMNCETSQLSESKDNLAELCRSYKSEGNHLADEDRYKMIEVIQHAIKRLVGNMRRLLELTSSSLPVDYEILYASAGSSLHSQASKNSFVDTPINQIKEQVTLNIHLVSQLKPDWLSKYQVFHLTLCVAHGSNIISDSVSSSTIKADKSFFQRLLFDEDIFLPISYNNLPREARLIITLYGTQLVQVAAANNPLAPGDGNQQFSLRRSSSTTSVCSSSPMYSSSPKSTTGGFNLNNAQRQQTEPVQVALAQSMAYFFNFDLKLNQGDQLLYMHPLVELQDSDIFIEAIFERQDPILVIELKRFPLEKKIYFPNKMNVREQTGPDTDSLGIKDFEQLDAGVKYVLNTIILEKRQNKPLMDDEKTLLWENRLYLTKFPEALPKLLCSVPSWSASELDHLYSLIKHFKPLNAIDALQLLLPAYPDSFVRQLAIDWISNQSDDELYDYLPQLLQAFRYEKTLDCPLFWLLMQRALKNVRIANLLYWQLKLNSKDLVLQERSETLINCLLHICGAAFWKSIDGQEELLAKLTLISDDIKEVRDSKRMTLLLKRLDQFQHYLMEKKPTMPWSPSLEVCDLDFQSCTYFPSKTLPLKLAFRSCEETCNKQISFFTYDTIFKMGDDLRQDMLTIQMIRIMEKLWLREGLDLRMVTYDCLATSDRQGMVEVVQNAETLRKIHQNSSFLAGAFNTKAIDNYIRLWNTSELEYKTALDNFLHSCAGYSVATYILGIGDRHNDNIMITTSGHLFHIDFGKFLGDAQMMGSIKRDRTPFVLTADMAYVINGGDRPSKKFQTFIEFCTMGFNIIRRHRNLFLNLFSLMSSANIHGLNSESVDYIDKMLMPDLSEAEAMAKFTRLIDECLNSFSTQMNFFVHNLAQLRFSNDNSKQTLLSFVPKTFTQQTDGRIESLRLIRLFKLYEPEKQYYYVVSVKRVGQKDPSEITRTFREFSELQMKLNYMFPSEHFHDIDRKTGSFLMDFVGRNNTREIAESRFAELQTFLRKLLESPEAIRNCDLIYTFFHPILRDQQATNNCDISAMMNESSSTFGSQEYSEAQRNALYLGADGQVKLKLSYQNSSLIIMMMHAKNLPKLEGSISPNCYVKTYLLPDPHKQTKRKTRVIRQNSNPSFMELIVYKLPKEALKRLTLQVSIWHSELVQYKAFMGAALIPLDTIDLSKETTSWYPLKNF